MIREPWRKELSVVFEGWTCVRYLIIGRGVNVALILIPRLLAWNLLCPELY